LTAQKIQKFNEFEPSNRFFRFFERLRDFSADFIQSHQNGFTRPIFVRFYIWSLNALASEKPEPIQNDRESSNNPHAGLEPRTSPFLDRQCHFSCATHTFWDGAEIFQNYRSFGKCG
jgi:hypothetical protein